MPPAPPCGNVGQVPCFLQNNEAFFSVFSAHVSRLFVLGYDLHCALDCCFGWIRFGPWAGRGDDDFMAG